MAFKRSGVRFPYSPPHISVNIDIMLSCEKPNGIGLFYFGFLSIAHHFCEHITYIL